MNQKFIFSFSLDNLSNFLENYTNQKWLFSNYIVRLFRMHWPPQYTALCLTHPTHSSIDEWSLLRFNNGKKWFCSSNYKWTNKLDSMHESLPFFFLQKSWVFCVRERVETRSKINFEPRLHSRLNINPKWFRMFGCVKGIQTLRKVFNGDDDDDVFFWPFYLFLWRRFHFD